jgi:hypothetical protein
MYYVINTYKQGKSGKLNPEFTAKISKSGRGGTLRNDLPAKFSNYGNRNLANRLPEPGPSEGKSGGERRHQPV